jgi:hypothetical protein
MNAKTHTNDPSLIAIDRICDNLESAGIAGKGSSAALRMMRTHWAKSDGHINPSAATDDIEAAIGMLEKVRKALYKQVEHSGPVKLVPTKLGQSIILSESSVLPLGTIRVSNMNFDVPRSPETEKLTLTILKGAPGSYKRAEMEIAKASRGLTEGNEKNAGQMEAGPTLRIQELLESVAAAMSRLATAT